MQLKEKNEMMVFSNEEFGDVRVVEINGEGWFVGKDVVERLGYDLSSNSYTFYTKKFVDEEDKLKCDSQSSLNLDYKTLGQRGGELINESGLYSLVLNSKLPSAKKFKRWVTSEVLPSIRKHGAYMTSDVLEQAIADPQFAIVLLTNLQNEKEAREIAENKVVRLEEKITNDEKYVAHSKAIEATEASIPFGTFADMLHNAGINMGQNTLLAWCRGNKLLVTQNGRRNEPTKKALDLEIIEVDTTPYIKNGKSGISRKPVITPKGQMYLLRKIIKENSIDYYKVDAVVADFAKEMMHLLNMSDLESELMLIKPSAYRSVWESLLEMANDIYEQGYDDEDLDIAIKIEEMLSEI